MSNAGEAKSELEKLDEEKFKNYPWVDRSETMQAAHKFTIDPDNKHLPPILVYVAGAKWGKGWLLEQLEKVNFAKLLLNATTDCKISYVQGLEKIIMKAREQGIEEVINKAKELCK